MPICFIVDKQGNPTNIYLLQPPGKDLEAHILEEVRASHYKPGMQKNKPDRVEFMFNFVFW